MMKLKYSKIGKTSTLFLVFLALVSLWTFSVNLWTNRAFFVDDSFIGFKYAVNLAKGFGLSFNQGDPPNEGYSNFLSVLIISMFVHNNFDPVIISKIIGAVSALITAIFLYRICILGGIKRAAAMLTACVYISQPAIARHAFSGIETNLYSALLVFLFFYAVTARIKNGFKNSAILVIAYSLAVLGRTEGIYCASSLLIFLFFYKFKNRLAHKGIFFYSCAASFLIGVSYQLWRLLYFKTLITSPMLVKTGVFFCLPGKFELISFVFRYGFIFLFAFFGWIISRRINALVNCSVFFSLLIFSPYLFTCHFMGFDSRYFMPGLAFVLILTAYAFEFLLSAISSKPLKAFFMLSCFFLVTPSNIVSANSSFVELRKFFFQSKQKPLESWTDIDIKIGKQLGRIKNDIPFVIASDDVGALAFYSKGIVVDLAGVTSSVIASSKNASEYSDNVFARNPDVFIMRTGLHVRYSEKINSSDTACACSKPCVWGPAERFGKMVLIEDARFKDRYVFIGKMFDSDKTTAVYYWNFWLRNDSPNFNQLSSLLKELCIEK